MRTRHPSYGVHVSDSPPLRVWLGRTVQRRRLEAGYSQEAFADRVGVHRTFMSTVERGASNVSLSTLVRIADALGLRAGELLLAAELAAEDARAASTADPYPPGDGQG